LKYLFTGLRVPLFFNRTSLLTGRIQPPLLSDLFPFFHPFTAGDAKGPAEPAGGLFAAG